MADEKRLIDATPIIKFIEDGLNNPNKRKAFGHDAVEILTEVEFAPTVDAVEVVRCKDCKHYRKNTGTCGKHSHFIWNLFDENHFCADGERKVNNAAD